MNLNYLQVGDILLINEMTVAQHGGNFVPPHNYLHENALDYCLESVTAEMFGAPLYPTIADKAAVYMFSIISNHVFQDGNKRTGLEAALLFLRLNGYFLADRDATKEPLKKDDLFRFAMAVASGEYDMDQTRAWFTAHVKQREQ